MRIYVASSKSNRYQPEVVARLRGLGHQVYDFREHGFSWEEVSPDRESWTADDYRAAIDLHDAPGEAIGNNLEGLARAHAVVMVMPCGPWGSHGTWLGNWTGQARRGLCPGRGEGRPGPGPDAHHGRHGDRLERAGHVDGDARRLPLCDGHFDSEGEVEDHIAKRHAGVASGLES